MAVIQSIPLEEALSTQATKEPSERTVRTRRIAQDAQTVFAAVLQQGAARIELTEDDPPAVVYLNGLRAALRRAGRTDVLTRKKRNQDTIMAWYRRPEDEARI